MGLEGPNQTQGSSRNPKGRFQGQYQGRHRPQRLYREHSGGTAVASGTGRGRIGQD